MQIDFEKAVSYIDTLYENDDTFKKKYIESTGLKKFGTVVDSDVSRMMQLVLWLVRPQKILEVGTSIGYSTVSMANIAKEYGGKITTIEVDAETAQQAIKNFRHAGVAECIEVITGDAQEIIPMFKENFDLIFQDVGDKTLYPALFAPLVAPLKPGGVFLAEDSLFPVIDMSASDPEDPDRVQRIKKSCESLEAFNIMIARCPDLRSTILPIGDGLTVAVKTGP